MNLKHLTDKTLLQDTRKLVSKEREYLTQILHHLKEIDRRKLYSDLGYSSIYDYCAKDLGYASASAHRRIQASRMLVDIPEIEEKIEAGLLNLSNIARAADFFRKNHVEDTEEKKEVLLQLDNLTKNEGEKKLFEIFGGEQTEKEKKRRVSKDETKVTLILSDGTLEKCQKLKDLMGKKTYTDLIDSMADIALKEIEKKKFKVVDKPKDSTPPADEKRVISSATKREVFLRDKKCVKCGSLKNLNFDHQLPFALGGKSDAGNVRLLCFNCNQRARMRARL